MKINQHHQIQDATETLLRAIGENVDRDGLQNTPERVAKAWEAWTCGYGIDPASVMTTFEEGDYDEMVLVKDIPIYSKCEHHLADIFGTVTIAYIPNGRVLGLSKLSRVANIFARRLQNQERMTVQIADALNDSDLKPRGVGVLMKARHMCMESRGTSIQGHHTVTSALRGVLRVGEPRNEFLRLANG